MDLPSTLVVGLSLSAAKFLIKRFVGESAKALDGPSSGDSGPGSLEEAGAAAGEIIGDALADAVKDRIKDEADRRKAARRFGDIGDDVAEKFVADLRQRYPHVSAERWEPVLMRITAALAGHVTADYVVRRHVDPAKLYAALKAVPLNVTPPLAPGDEPLFDDAIREAARYLAAISDKLPKFDAANARESLGLLASLRDDFDHVLTDVRFIREQVEQRLGPAARDEFEIDYRQAVARNLDWVELFGVDLPQELRRTRLTDAFVTLSLDDEPDEVDDEAGGDDADGPAIAHVTTEDAFADLLPQTGRMLIRGPAGGGKTTLVKWAAIQAARLAGPERSRRDRREFDLEPDGVRIRPDDERDRLAAADAADWRQRIPFVVYLRHCQEGELPAPKDFPAVVAREIGDPPVKWVETALTDGRGLVLIDGIDEVPTLNRSRLQAAVRRLVEAYPRSYFVLTTRPEAVDGGWLADVGFREVLVAPMSDPDRNQFIRRWYEAVARGKQQGADAAAELGQRAEELIRALGSAPWLVPLTANPLLCAMTCALFLARRGFLPDGLREMCEVLCEMMLHRLDVERRIDLSRFDHPYPQLKYAHKKAVMRQVAYHMVLNEYSTLPVPVVVEQVGRALRRIPDRSADEAGALYAGLLDRSGMWREATPREGATPATIEFQHNTFKEFLAGEQVADEGNVGMVLDRLDKEVWQRVGLFAFAAGNQAFQNDFLTQLFQRIPQQLPRTRRGKDSAGDEATRRRAVFALQCRPFALKCDDAVKERLNALAAQLVPPRNMTDAACLAAGGNAVVPLLCYQHRLVNVQVACIRALKLIGTPEAQEALMAYCESEGRETACRELCEAVDPFLIRGLRLIERLEAGEFLPWYVQGRISDLSALRGNKKIATLDLYGNPVSDVSPLAGLTALQSLDLSGSQVSDVSPLAGLTGLRIIR